MVLWMFVVYFPQAHMVWGVDGMMNGVSQRQRHDPCDRFRRRHGGAHDLGVVGADPLPDPRQTRRALGKRTSRRTAWSCAWSAPGCCGSAGTDSTPAARVAADVIAANAFTTTTLATAVASLVWPMVEWMITGQAQRARFLFRRGGGPGGDHAGLRFRHADRARWSSGSIAGLVPWFFCYKVKAWFGYDDALDTFGVHAIGGTIGALLTGILARNSANGNLADQPEGLRQRSLAPNRLSSSNSRPWESRSSWLSSVRP